jgi:signal transduction histidine kinase
MDLWVIGNRAVLLFYVIAASFQPSGMAAWFILAYLGCVCLTVAIPISRKQGSRQALRLFSAAFVLFCAYRLDPHFLLLFPVDAYELTIFTLKRWGWALLAVAMPAALVPSDLLPLYIISASLSFLLQACGNRMLDKLTRIEADRERMREDLQKLTRSLHEYNEYMRQSEYTIKLEERSRLSQQIHDEVGHAMTGALIQMEASRRLLHSDRDKASELLGNAIGISREGLEKIRMTLKDMKPKSEELGIRRLRLFVDELSAKRNIAATLTYEGNIDVISPIQWKIIQDNVTESVTNSLKYANADAIHIEISVLNKFIKAVVSDNGSGKAKVVKGLGIIGMEERAASAGGTVIVDGTKGFTVTTLLPTMRNEVSHPV